MCIRDSLLAQGLVSKTLSGKTRSVSLTDVGRIVAEAILESKIFLKRVSATLESRTSLANSEETKEIWV